jgi:hypothetical protein
MRHPREKDQQIQSLFVILILSDAAHRPLRCTSPQMDGAPRSRTSEREKIGRKTESDSPISCIFAVSPIGASPRHPIDPICTTMLPVDGAVSFPKSFLKPADRRSSRSIQIKSRLSGNCQSSSWGGPPSRNLLIHQFFCLNTYQWLRTRQAFRFA